MPETGDWSLVAVGQSDTVLIELNDDKLAECAADFRESLLVQWAESLAKSAGVEALKQPTLSTLRGSYHQTVLEAFIGQAVQEFQARDSRLREKPERDSQSMGDALTAMAAAVPGSKFIKPAAPSHLNTLYEACALVAQELGITVLGKAKPFLSSTDPVIQIAHLWRCRVRKVELMGKWWKKDNGPLLGFTEDETPVALLPAGPRKYEMVDPTVRQATRVDGKLASTLKGEAWMFYRPLPDTGIGPLELLKFGLTAAGKTLVSIFWLGIITGLLSLVMPVATGILVNTIIPSGEKNALFGLAVALLAATLGSGAFKLTQAVAVLHMEGKMDGALQSAIMDRLLRLPVPFFRTYSTGDLANRALGINAIRSILSGATISSLMSSMFSFFSFALLFYYDWRLALVATALVLILCLQIFLTGYFTLKYRRPMMDLEGNISGQVYQLLTGVSKLRVAGAEVRAFSQWAHKYAAQRELSFKAGMVSVNSSSFQSAYHVLTTAVLFAFVAHRGYDAMNTGDFLAFYAAFGQFLSALSSLTGTLASLLTVGPIMDRARPILAQKIETVDDKPDAGILSGKLSFNQVSFRYSSTAPWTLRQVSLEVNPGEFVAIVGPSGAGKSTLLRLLLGFEKPEFGTVMYDDGDLHSYNLQSVRRQLGVVLQHGNLMPGDIFSSIVGSTGMTQEDAWEAARVAGIAEDIEAMPMGMHTVIPEGATTISGGQRQRLMIARAIVTKPKILFFDEATSALDAQTQQAISKGIEGLKATRIVIAHRLSTIRNADRIYVLANRTVVQSGTFEELLNQPGEFADLAHRQMV
jgi:ATP-binding cassette subfamily C protein